jgi:hypothetical protein
MSELEAAAARIREAVLRYNQSVSALMAAQKAYKSAQEDEIACRNDVQKAKMELHDLAMAGVSMTADAWMTGAIR